MDSVVEEVRPIWIYTCACTLGLGLVGCVMNLHDF
jgi:hypothetical protein